MESRLRVSHTSECKLLVEGRFNYKEVEGRPDNLEAKGRSDYLEAEIRSDYLEAKGRSDYKMSEEIHDYLQPEGRAVTTIVQYNRFDDGGYVSFYMEKRKEEDDQMMFGEVSQDTLTQERNNFYNEHSLQKHISNGRD